MFIPLVASWLLLCATLGAQPLQVAVTIDDLPWAHSGPGQCEYLRVKQQTARLTKILRDQRVPTTVFAIGGNCSNLTDDQYAELLRMWRSAGTEIGNHTHSHRGLNKAPIEEYEADIVRADEKLRKLTGVERIEFFRSPMLQTGVTPEVKDRLERFLEQRHWRQAPVTFDNSDWMFANVYAAARNRGDAATLKRVREEYVPYLESTIAFFEKRGPEIAGHVFPQILLLHANDLNADMLPDVLDMLRRRGYSFVTLRQALNDPAYAMKNTYAGTGGFSLIHRWAMSRTEERPKGAEPDEPAWLREQFERDQKQ